MLFSKKGIGCIFFCCMLFGSTQLNAQTEGKEMTTITIIDDDGRGNVKTQIFTTSDPDEVDRILKKYESPDNPNREIRIEKRQELSTGFCERDDDQGFLGVYLDESSAQNGAVITQIMDGTAADKSDLRAGDIITHVDGKTTSNLNSVLEELQERKKDELVKLSILRDGEGLDMQITMGSCPNTALGLFEMPFDNSSFEEMMFWNDSNWTNLTFDFDSILHFGTEALEPSAYLGITSNEKPEEKAYVNSVAQGSAAEEMGLQKGDIITHLNGEKIDSFTQLGKKVKVMKPGENITLIILRNDDVMTVNGNLGERSLPKSDALFIAPGLEGMDENGTFNYEFFLDSEEDSIWDKLQNRFPFELSKVNKRFELTIEDLNEMELASAMKSEKSKETWTPQVDITPLDDANVLLVTIPAEPNETYVIKWSTVDGKLLQRDEKTTYASELKTVVDLSDQQDGEYILAILKDNKSFFQKVSVQR